MTRVSLALLVCAAAFGQAADPKDAARARLADGIGLYDAGEFARALAAFEEA